MNRINEKFAELKKQKRAALMPYLPLGFPTIETSQQILHAVVEAGADVIELGVPFSDPIADGAVIQAATQTALKNGMTLEKCLRLVRAARASGIITPFVLMGYLNPIMQWGFEKFAFDARAAGVDGIIIPDLPPEEASALDAATRANDLDLIFLAAPTSTPQRLQKIANATRGFLYLVSVAGVTGARTHVAADLAAFIARTRAITAQPLCVGFGIGNAASVQAVARMADGVIVGSALVSAIASAPHPVHAAHNLVAELRRATSI